MLSNMTDNTIDEIQVVLNKGSSISNSVLASYGQLQDCMSLFTVPGYEMSRKDTFIITAESIYVNNIFSSLNYENILIVPSFTDVKYFDDDDQVKLVSDVSRLEGDVGAHSFACINRFFNASSRVFVAYPEFHESYMWTVLKKFDVHVIDSNHLYTMGDETYEVTVPEGVEFDAVILAGIGVNEGETFQVSDIKNDFSQYCVDDFDLIDFFADDENSKVRIWNGQDIIEKSPRLIGEEKNIDDIIDFINTNTMRHTTGHDTHSSIKTLNKLIRNTIKVY